MQRLLGLSTLVLAVFFLASCGGTSTPLRDTTITGTVNAPNGGDVLGTVVSLCYEGNCQDTRGQSITIAQAGTSNSFSFSNLESGTWYTIHASKDANGNGVIDESDYQGSWSSVTAPAQDIIISLNAGSEPDHAKSQDNTVNQVPDGSMTGTWTGQTTTEAYGVEDTVMTLTQTGTSLSGRLTLNPGDLSTDLTGSISGDTVTLSGSYVLNDNAGDVTYTYQGTVSEGSYSGTITLNFPNGASETGSFAMAQEGGQPDPVEPDPTELDMTGTWTGQTTTEAYGVEDTVMTLTQTGTSLSGRLTLNPGDLSTDLTGSISGDTVTLSGSYSLNDNSGNVTYTYQGTVSEGSYSGTITLNFPNGASETGSFAMAQEGGQPDPVEPDPTEPVANVTGTWNGTMTFVDGSTATFTTVLTQSGAFVNGEVLAEVNDASWSAQRLPIFGHLSSTRLALATRNIANSALDFTGVVTGGSMAGQGAIGSNGAIYRFTYAATLSGG